MRTTVETLGGEAKGVKERQETFRTLDEQMQSEAFRRTVSQSGKLFE
jgi:hypothetical protein